MAKNNGRLSRFFIDPVKLSLTDKLLSVVFCFVAILICAIITQLVTETSQPILVASMGASAVILLIIPNSPLAQPWSFVGGQLLSASIGMICALQIDNITIAAPVAVGFSVLAMLLLRCLHPPAAATALAPVLAGDALSKLGYAFVLLPVASNVIVLLLIAIIVNRWLLGRDYPAALSPTHDDIHNQANTEITVPFNPSRQDIEQALKSMDSFIDLTTAEIGKLLGLIEVQTYQRRMGDIVCAEIMSKDVLITEFATEVEDAWQLMLSKGIKAMPVLDRSRRVVGILTRNDFFKYINMSAISGFQQRLHQFIKRTPNIHTDKPEVVGHIMTTNVVILSENAPIAELIALMSVQGYRQIPIVNEQQRLVGVVYPANLITALYRNGLASEI